MRGGHRFRFTCCRNNCPSWCLRGPRPCALINLVKLGPYHALQSYGPNELTGALVLIPFALAGTVADAYFTRKIADDWFFKWVQVGLLLISLKLILDVVTA